MPYEEIKARYETAQALVTYLLYEREEDTQLRVAFAGVVQQRHVEFHADGNKDSKFTECSFEICINALKILQESKQKRIELNEFSLEIVNAHTLHVRKTGRSCIAWLEERTDGSNRTSSGLILDI